MGALNLRRVKPRILVCVGCFLPGMRGGGPIRTIANLVDKLGEDFDFYIVTMDRDIGDKKPYDNVTRDAWTQVGKAKVFYVSNGLGGLSRFYSILVKFDFDILYLNSFFNPKFTLFPLLLWFTGIIHRGVRLVWAPRGELSSAALKIKAWKKLPVLIFIKRLLRCRDVDFQATSPAEKEDIINEVCAKNVYVAENLSGLNFSERHAGNYNIEFRADALRVCFLSRISPMKNLDFALDVLSKASVNIDFYIFGPKEKIDYWDYCERLISKLPPNVAVKYFGGIDNSDVRGIISLFDVFFVPSRGENFGHVFIEALSAGVPILVSDKTPWRDLVRSGVGWDLPLESIDQFVNVLENYHSRNEAERHRIKRACLEYASHIINDESVLMANRRLFSFSLDVTE